MIIKGVFKERKACKNLYKWKLYLVRAEGERRRRFSHRANSKRRTQGESCRRLVWEHRGWRKGRLHPANISLEETERDRDRSAPGSADSDSNGISFDLHSELLNITHWNIIKTVVTKRDLQIKTIKTTIVSYLSKWLFKYLFIYSFIHSRQGFFWLSWISFFL